VEHRVAAGLVSLGAHMMRAGRRAPDVVFRNRDAEAAIEGHRCLDVAAYNVELIEHWPWIRHRHAPRENTRALWTRNFSRASAPSPGWLSRFCQKDLVVM